MTYRNDVREGFDEAEWTFWFVFWRAIVPIMILFSFIGLISWMISVPSGVATRVLNPDHIISSYEWYENQYQDIQAADNQIATAEKSVTRFQNELGPREAWKYDERQEMARLNDILDGLRYYKSKLVADYNAKSRMITRSAWKRSDLPYHIDN